jgi:hypothetical protein
VFERRAQEQIERFPQQGDERTSSWLSTNLGTTSIYLQGIDPEEIITAVRTRRAPMMSAIAGLWL